MTSPVRRRFAFVALLIVLFPSCGKKEQPEPQARPQETPSAATTPTLPPPTAVPTPPPVWRASHWGMTKAEVLAAFPGEAQPLAQPAPFAQPQPGSSLSAGSSDLAIPTYEADGTTFRVLFGFESGVLNRVHLSAVKVGDSTCADLEKAITERHSEPSQRSTTGSSLKGEEITWKRPDQTITLACAGLPSLGFQRVTVDYMAPSGDPPKN